MGKMSKSSFFWTAIQGLKHYALIGEILPRILKCFPPVLFHKKTWPKQGQGREDKSGIHGVVIKGMRVFVLYSWKKADQDGRSSNTQTFILGKKRIVFKCGI